MSRAQGMEAPFEAEVAGAGSLLLLVPAMDPADDEGCGRLLFHDSGESSNLLSVTLTDSPDDKMATWRAHYDEKPERIGFVSVGDTARSAAAVGGSVSIPNQPMSVETISSPGDLTGIGMKISKILSDWEDDGTPTKICFHSLTALLQFVDLQRAFRFLHVLTGRIDTVNGVGHFHMDPTAHDDREINTLKSLFDAVVQFEDGEWVVRSR